MTIELVLLMLKFLLPAGVFVLFHSRRVLYKRVIIPLCIFSFILVIVERGYIDSSSFSLRLISEEVLLHSASRNYRTKTLLNGTKYGNYLTDTVWNLTEFVQNSIQIGSSDYSVQRTLPNKKSDFPYEYLINEKDFCDGNGSDLYIINVVGTAPWEFMARTRIRRLWGNRRWQNMTGFRTVFFLGWVADSRLMEAVQEESHSYRDIVQLSFLDTYDNLTIKTLCCLHWLQHYCPTPAWVLKSDVDVLINIFELSR